MHLIQQQNQIQLVEVEAEVDKLGADKLKAVPVDLYKLGKVDYVSIKLRMINQSQRLTPLILVDLF